MSTVRPQAIEANRNLSQMTIRWSDGHTSEYHFSLLRYACPCAECRGGHANMRSEPDAEVFSRPPQEAPATMIRKVEAVGSYALTIEWEDGHHFGIYTWQFLRALCPCAICRPGE